ncbi:MAG: hypothetical protein ABI844_07120, partial [Saprospiraceae bacterium]
LIYNMISTNKEQIYSIPAHLASQIILSINKSIKFSPDRNVEISNRNMELANATVSLAVERIDVKNLDARILQSNSGSILEANVNENTDAEMKIVNING